MIEKKDLSVFNQEMLDLEFKVLFEKGYKEFLLSELRIELMDASHKLAKELAAGV